MRSSGWLAVGAWALSVLLVAPGGWALPNGAACTDASVCDSGFCTDGNCCDSACSGQCASCVGGYCGTQVGKPLAPRPACAGGSGVCAGTCDGINAQACSYPANNSCGLDACVGTDAVEKKCDGAGACSDLTTSCAPFTCQGNSCMTTCTGNSDCLPNARCEQAQCVLRTQPVCELGRSVAVDGAATSCAPFVCDEATGSCLGACSTDDDCDGAVCRAGDCIPERELAPLYPGGCEASRDSRSGPAAILVFVLGGLVLRRRRAR